MSLATRRPRAELPAVLRHQHARRHPRRAARRVRRQPSRDRLVGRTTGSSTGCASTIPTGSPIPGGYLDRLAEATGGRAGVGREDPRGRRAAPGALAAWPAPRATTRSPAIDRLFVDPAAGRLDALDAEVRGGDAVGRPDPRHQARRRRRDAQQRGPPPGARPASTGRRAIADDGRRRRRRTARLLPRLPLIPPARRSHLDDAAAEAGRRRPDLAATIDAIVTGARRPAPTRRPSASSRRRGW